MSLIDLNFVKIRAEAVDIKCVKISNFSIQNHILNVFSVLSQFPELPLFKRKLIAIVFVNRDALTEVGLGVSSYLADEGVVQEEAF